jgi:hypothetical protein
MVRHAIHLVQSYKAMTGKDLLGTMETKLVLPSEVEVARQLFAANRFFPSKNSVNNFLAFDIIAFPPPPLMKCLVARHNLNIEWS